MGDRMGAEERIRVKLSGGCGKIENEGDYIYFGIRRWMENHAGKLF
jgi:hypothetical protein